MADAAVDDRDAEPARHPQAGERREAADGEDEADALAPRLAEHGEGGRDVEARPTAQRQQRRRLGQRQGLERTAAVEDGEHDAVAAALAQAAQDLDGLALGAADLESIDRQ